MKKPIKFLCIAFSLIALISCNKKDNCSEDAYKAVKSEQEKRALLKDCPNLASKKFRESNYTPSPKREW